MSEQIKDHERGPQILNLLYEHGPLTTRGMRMMLTPPITKSGVRQAIRILKRKKLIVSSGQSQDLYGTKFYQISLSHDTRPAISKMIGLPAMSLERPHQRNPDMFHSQECAVWSTWFGWMFSEAKVARDIHYKHDQSFQMPFPIDSTNWSLRPDILMRIPSEDGIRTVTIAIDCEKFHYHSGRQAEKLRRLSKVDFLDGVIYFGSVGSIEGTAKSMFPDRGRARDHVKNCFDKNFFLYSTGAWSMAHKSPIMFDSYLKPISLYDWVQCLRKTDTRPNRKTESELPAYCV